MYLRKILKHVGGLNILSWKCGPLTSSTPQPLDAFQSAESQDQNLHFSQAAG